MLLEKGHVLLLTVFMCLFNINWIMAAPVEYIIEPSTSRNITLGGKTIQFFNDLIVDYDGTTTTQGAASYSLRIGSRPLKIIIDNDRIQSISIQWERIWKYLTQAQLGPQEFYTIVSKEVMDRIMTQGFVRIFPRFQKGKPTNTLDIQELAYFIYNKPLCEDPCKVYT